MRKLLYDVKHHWMSRIAPKICALSPNLLADMLFDKAYMHLIHVPEIHQP